MVKLEWGAKRTCLSCGARFYDMQTLPATCPKCGTLYELQSVARTRRARTSAVDARKEVLTVDDVTLEDIEIDDSLTVGIDDDLIEDADDLDEGLDDISDVLDDDSEDH
jgi:uncharacterized protein (TIGR02300 family)